MVAAATSGVSAVVHGVDMGKVNAKHLAKVLKKLKVEVAKDEAAESLVSKLVTFYSRSPPKEISDPCDNCGGKSDMSLNACPFCGLEDDDTASHSEKPAVSSALAGNGAALATVPKNDLVAASRLAREADLDQAVREVQKLKSMAAVSHWHLGAKIADIYEKDTWRLRTKDGKPLYKGFDSFCHHELGFTPQNAYKLMDLSRHFTEAQVVAWGPSKLGFVLQVPDEDQKRLLDEMDEGRRAGKETTKRELEEKVRKIKKEKGFTRPSRSGKEHQGAGAGGKGRGGSKTITVANIIKREKLKAYKKPAGKTWDPKDLVRCKRLADVPFATRLLANNVTETITVVTDADGQIDIVVEIRRNEE